ncbi:MAG TPA: DUF4265 domain-containing protein [Kofleriaceae bacterium]|nr:DUF4265 domain-containing protein [Kofleriaceae bacterium]
MTEVVLLRAGVSSAGVSVQEEVLAERQGHGRYRVLRSPGLVQGVAADDIIDVDGNGDFHIVIRGGNVSVHVLAIRDMPRLEAVLRPALEALGGRLDGKAPKLLVFTVPLSAGFVSIEEALNRTLRGFADAEWYFGNVYDPVDGVTPLNWWKQ